VSEQVKVTVDGPVGIVEMCRGPHNFFDEGSIRELGEALVDVDGRPELQTVVLCSEGKNFSAGADLRGANEHTLRRVYRAASALFTTRKPIVVAVQGAAVGGGLGLALVGDFRVAARDARFTTNFARLGFHHGFGISVTLPALVGQQRALDMLYTGRNVVAERAMGIGLCDRVSDGDPRADAVVWATEIAASAPLSLQAIRSTMRGHLASRVLEALHEETAAQVALFATHDFHEGVSASIEKRAPDFSGT
jgi:enoyl-CoA hydratase/carnithine racemase